MKRKMLWGLCILLTIAASHVSAQTVAPSVTSNSKLAPMVHAFAAQQVEAARRAGGQVSQKPVLFVVRLHPEADASEASQQIEATGAEVKTAIGRMLMVAATARQLQDVAALEGVQLIEKPVKPMLKLDNSRKATHTDEVHTGTGVQLPQAYQGDGVIIGILDAGFDVTNPAFKDEQGNLRVKAAYYPGMTNGKGNKAVVDGKELEGTLFDTPELMLDTARLKDDIHYHGTHVAGCAAASPISTVKGILEVLGLPSAIPSLSKNQPEAVTFRLVGDVLYADGAADGIPVTIYSLSGTVLQRTTVQQGSITLPGLQRGVYAVQLGQLGSTLIRK